MFTKGIVDEDFVNYKVPSMFINTCFCTFKCDQESGRPVCQNSDLANTPTIQIKDSSLVKRFLANPITKAIVFGGLEPMDTLGHLLAFIEELNKQNVTADLVIYTGYTHDEIFSVVEHLYDLCFPYRDLVVKYGRFIPNGQPVFDEELGVTLASDNQYAMRYFAMKKSTFDET